MTAPTVYLLDRRTVGDSALAAAERSLSMEDQRRRAAMTSTTRREQFVLGRALLRWALARAMDADAEALQIDTRADGRPVVTMASALVPRYSLSHSADWIACALHPMVAIGVDVETMDTQRDLAGIATQAFGEPEQAWLRERSDPIPAFYRLWTGREALTKLATELAQPFDATRAALVLGGALATAPPPARGWHFAENRPSLALSLVWAEDVGAPRIEQVDAGFVAGLDTPAARVTAHTRKTPMGGIRS